MNYREITIYIGVSIVIIYIIIQLIYKFKNNSENNVVVTKEVVIREPQRDQITGYVNDNIMKYDREVLHDELVAPWKRPARYIFESYAYDLMPQTIYTRGQPDNFSFLGYGVNPNNNSDIVKLFGRQKFPGSDNWMQYYITKKLNYDDDVKLELKDQRKELYDNDTFNVEMLNTNYTVHLNKTFEYP